MSIMHSRRGLEQLKLESDTRDGMGIIRAFVTA